MGRPAPLNLSREQLERILELHPDPFALVCHRDDVIVRCNVAYAQIHGASPDEIMGRRDSDLGMSIDQEARGKRLQSLEDHGTYSVVERQMRLPDGSVRWVSASVALVEIDGELYRAGFGQDITERKQVEEALRISEEKYARAFAASPDAVALLVRPEMRILECNEGFGRITGHDPGEAVGKTVDQLGIWDSEEEREAVRQELEAAGTFTDREVLIRAKDGSKRVLHISGRTLEIQGEDCFLAIARDVTEQRHLEEERARLTSELKGTLARIETLRGVVPICAACKKIRNDAGYWEQVEVYVRDRSLAEFSHGLCPDCARQAFDQLDS